MLLQLPTELHYPITITSILVNPGDSVKKYAQLLRYKFRTYVFEDDEFALEPKKVEKWFPATWESPVEGVVKRWMVREGSVVQKGVDIVEIEEPCSHDVQFGGMCADCGMDMTIQDYMSFSNKSRADINMTHDNMNVLVSHDEAARLEAEAEQRLLKSRKLSLVVDLDQTIIHATVDPTVAQWQNNPSEINHDVLQDVKSFALPDPSPVPEGHRPTETSYYVKLRPGLRQFLENISKLYELHIYTMGTRAYALNVAKIVDPEGKIFGSRVLSRDESGSMTEKDLRRLFPNNTKMVVIIDDRGDVWKWSENLIRVKPYDFFVGIGDINSSFLPKKQEFPAGPVPALETTAETSVVDPLIQDALGESTEEKAENVDDGEKEDTIVEDAPPDALLPEEINAAVTDLTTLQQLVRLGASDDKLLLEEQAHQLSDAIRAQQESRPLAKQQQILDLKDEVDAVLETEDPSVSTTPSEHGGAKHRHQLIKDEFPRELEPLERNLVAVHSSFFREYDRITQLYAGRKRGRVRDNVPDVKDLMSELKRKTLSGVVLVFSGVIPLGANVYNSDIAIWAKSFGAVIEDNLTSRVTHVIAARSRTAKVRQASRYPHIHIVTPQWLYDSISNWEKQPLEPYLIAIHPEDRNPVGSLPPDLLSDPVNIPMSSEDELDDEEEMDIEEESAEVLKEGITIDRGEVYRELEEFLADLSSDDEDDDEDIYGGGGDDDEEDEEDEEEEGDHGDGDEGGKKKKQKKDHVEEDEEEGGGKEVIMQNGIGKEGEHEHEHVEVQEVVMTHHDDDHDERVEDVSAITTTITTTTATTPPPPSSTTTTSITTASITSTTTATTTTAPSSPVKQRQQHHQHIPKKRSRASTPEAGGCGIPPSASSSSPSHPEINTSIQTAIQPSLSSPTTGLSNYHLSDNNINNTHHHYETDDEKVTGGFSGIRLPKRQKRMAPEDDGVASGSGSGLRTVVSTGSGSGGVEESSASAEGPEVTMGCGDGDGEHEGEGGRGQGVGAGAGAGEEESEESDGQPSPILPNVMLPSSPTTRRRKSKSTSIPPPPPPPPAPSATTTTTTPLFSRLEVNPSIVDGGGGGGDCGEEVGEGGVLGGNLRGGGEEGEGEKSEYDENFDEGDDGDGDSLFENDFEELDEEAFAAALAEELSE